jgi:hypothetical protein|tara:strand:+ start:2003 stop:2152 length:150 start_codon:yes stop_codon:yes gene_type:complete
MIELIILLFIVSIISGLGKWATDRRYKRKYEEKYNDCCGTGCCNHKEDK